MQPFYAFLDDRPATIALALALLAAVVFLLRGSGKSWLAHIHRKPLMTANEAEFYGRLKRALPGYEVFPQVSFAAILTDDGKVYGNARWNVRARFDRKIADFVICDRRTLAVVALVELDDRTHTASADRQRDAITKAGGYQTLRFQSRHKPTEAEIAELFRHSAAWNIP